MDPPDLPPPPDLDPPLPASNVYALVVPGKDPLNTFQRINVLSGLKETTVWPLKLVENQITIITLFYGNDINHNLALASTVVFKKAIEAEIRSGSYELGLVGLLDRNISFKTISKKECAIIFKSVVDEAFIKCTLSVLLTAIRESHLAQEYGFEPPKRYQYQLFMMHYLLGFLREEIDYALTRAGYEPKHLKLLQGKSALNSGTNIVGTHGNVILKTVVGAEPLTSIKVSTNRGIFVLNLEQKDFYTSYTPNDNTQSGSTEHNNLFKTRLCKHHSSGSVCYSGNKCSFAHGASELRPKEAWAKHGFTASTAHRAEVPTTDNKQPGSDTADITDPDVMATDEVQLSDCNVIEQKTGPIVEVRKDNNPILEAGALSGSSNSSYPISLNSIKTVESLDGGNLSISKGTTTPDALVTGVGISNSNTNSAISGRLLLPLIRLLPCLWVILLRN